jgi:hypothetical protein
VGCGLLWRVAGYRLLYAQPAALFASSDDSNNVAAAVTAHILGDRICFFVTARGLEPNIDSHLNDPSGPGRNCAAINGCGLHVYSGSSCDDTESQGGGHFYNNETFPIDPWLDIGYRNTDASGNAYHADCVYTGERVFTDKPFLVRANNGSRVACDLLTMPGPDYCDYYCKHQDKDNSYSYYGYGIRRNEQWCHDCYDYVYYNQ